MKSVRSLGVAFAMGLAATFAQIQPSAAQTYNWTGLYFGAHLGGAWSTSDATDVLPGGGDFTSGFGDTFSFDGGGIAGGGQLGYQAQFSNWVLGAEIAGTWADLGDPHRSPFFPGTDRVDMRITPVFTATARLGYAWDRWLAYVKGGYAGADAEFRADDTFAGVGLRGNSQWLSGYTVGAGFEYALYDGIRLGLDYAYVDLGSSTLHTVTSLGAPERYDLSSEMHTVTARLNFQLSRPAPAPIYEPMK